jgi:uncharacterized protein YkwD
LGKNVGAVPATALSMLAAILLMCTGALLTPAHALAAPAKRKSTFCANANLLPTTANTATVDAATLCLIDNLRTAYHLRTLRSNHELQAVAATQVGEMVRRNYFADDSPSGRTPATLIEAMPYAAHATSLATGENIAWGTGADATPAYVVAAWMNSPPHRELILTADFHDAGVSATAAVPSVVTAASPSAVTAASPSGVTAAGPSVVEDNLPGATYAIEFGARGREVSQHRTPALRPGIPRP